jgi:hypothetical protein
MLEPLPSSTKTLSEDAAQTHDCCRIAHTMGLVATGVPFCDCSSKLGASRHRRGERLAA